MDVAEHVKSSFLYVVNEADQRTTSSWIVYQQQYLWTPKFYMLLPWIQQKEVFPHLKKFKR